MQITNKMFKSLLKLGTPSERDKKKQASQQKSIPQLPPNFADEVFNLELEAEQDNVDITVVNRLVELYAIAIEYYETIKSDKYQIFKNKTRTLLLKQNVSQAMDKAHEVLKSEPNEELDIDLKKDKLELNVDEGLMKHRQKELELNVKYIQQQDTKESVKSLMNTYSQDIRQNKKIIQRDTDFQKNLILKRLQQRKMKKNGGEQVDTDEFERAKSDGGRTPNAYDLLIKNDLDMDMVEITQPNTEPTPNLLNFKKGHTKSSDDLIKDFISHNNYEQMIQQQLDFTKSMSNYHDPNFNENNYVKAPVDNTIDIFKAQEPIIAQKAKKKKVRISQKSVMELQLQNSIIPF